MNLADLAKKLDSLNREIPQMALFFGESFTGKTVAASQFARKYKLIWIDCDNGYTSIFGNLPTEFWKNITLIRLQDGPASADVANNTWKLLSSSKGCHIDNESGKIIPAATSDSTFVNLFETDSDTILVLDSLTKLSESAMDKYLGKSTDGNFKKPEFDHYKSQGMFLRSVITLASKLPCHKIFITHEEEIEQENKTRKLTPVCGTRNFSAQICRMFSHSVHFTKQGKNHVMSSSTQAANNATSGSRGNKNVKSVEDLLDIFSFDFTKLNEVSFSEAKAADEIESKSVPVSAKP